MASVAIAFDARARSCLRQVPTDTPVRPEEQTAVALVQFLGAGDAPAAAPAAAGAAVRRKRRPPILPRGTRFASEADRQAARRDVLAREVALSLPEPIQFRLLGGELGLRQVPDLEERAASLLRIVLRAAGPQGDALLDGQRALQVLPKSARYL